MQTILTLITLASLAFAQHVPNNHERLAEKHAPTPTETKIWTTVPGISTVFQNGFDSSDNAQVDFFSTHYDWLILSKGTSKIDNIHKRNDAPHAGNTILRYMKMQGAKPDQELYPLMEQTDLFWKTAAGTTIQFAVENPWTIAKIFDPRFIDEQIRILIGAMTSTTSYSEGDYDGVFLDNTHIMDPTLDGTCAYLTACPEGYDITTHLADMAKNLRTLRARLDAQFPTERQLIFFNGYNGWSEKYFTESVTAEQRHAIKGLDLAAMPEVDGIMFEIFSSKEDGESYGVDRMMEKFADVDEVTQQMGKVALIQDRGESTDIARRLYSLANYLMVANEKTAWYYSQSSTYDTENVPQLPEYEWNLGNARPRFMTANGLLTRVFEKGMVVLNLDETGDAKTMEYHCPTGACFAQMGIQDNENDGYDAAWPNDDTLSWTPVTTSTISVPPMSAIILKKIY